MRLTLLLLFLSFFANAQDTIRVMQYNILYYGSNAGSCDNSTAAMAIKDAAFKKIAKSVLPDVLAVNEMANNTLYGDRILQNVLNTGGINFYRKGQYTNTAGSGIVNMIFYNSEKLGIHSEEVINGIIRDINLTRLYYKDPLHGNGATDTVFFTVINAHLKAGSTTSDQALRDDMTTNIISNLTAKGIRDNYLALGDFNSRSSSEAGIQNLLNPSDSKVKFLDPINSLGSWNNNSNFASIHTQSTHVTSSCPAGGGLDDRFDLIFASEYIMGDSAGVRYLPGTYTAFGQDGNHFNNTINSGTNTAVPDSIADALYDMSDHLPVYLDLEIETAEITSLKELSVSDQLRLLSNPVEDVIRLKTGDFRNCQIRITDLQGKEMKTLIQSGNSEIEIPFNPVQGVYILSWISSEGKSGTIRLLKR